MKPPRIFFRTWLPIIVFPITISSCGPGTPTSRLQGGGLEGGGEKEARVDAVLAEYAKGETPGCAVGVLTQGGLSLAKGYGMANLDYGLPITPKTVFRTGSVSKQFTAAVVTLLAQEGRLSLDDGIRRYFPELPELHDPITVRHLLHHTSGIRDYLELQEMRGLGDESTYTEDDVVKLLARQKGLNFAPGAEYRYSNSGYLLLSRLVHRVTGETLRTQAHRLLFEPLGMNSTHFHDDHREIVPNRATGYGSGPDGRFYVDQTTLDIVGDGGVFTNIEDLSLWMANFWRLEVGGSEWLTRMETRGVLTSGDTLDYAFGLRTGVQRGIPTIGHGGAFVGYRAATLRYPTEEVAVMALCNYGRANPSQIVEEIGEIWLGERMGPEPESPAETNVEASDRPDAVAYTPLSSGEQDPFLGEYYSEELDGTYRIFREDGSLFLDVNGAYTLPLEGRGPDTLVADWLTLTCTTEGGLVTGFQAGSGRAGGVTFVRR